MPTPLLLPLPRTLVSSHTTRIRNLCITATHHPITTFRPPQPRAAFGTFLSPLLKNLPPRPKPPPDEEIEESFLKGSGPGGQKINKTSSAVQLKHLPTGIVVKSQATRSRSQNRTIARQLLADRLDDLARGDQSRSAVVGEVKRRKKASSAKKSRRKYRKLEDGGGEGAESGAENAQASPDTADEPTVVEERR
ncbi:RF-1 domain-containing protein [Xylariomycetidae sp. FL2044]|nr:RF-1 domain-containing protein [Xylariomycetidae sp. FL2044]